MGNAIEVTDSLSNSPEQIEQAAKAIGNGDRRKVFEAIYHHKAKAKTVSFIVHKTGLPRKRVLEEGRRLVNKGIARQTKKDDGVAYEKIDFFHAHKREILNFAAHPRKLANLATKRRPAVNFPKSVTIPATGARATRITIDDVSSFSKVKKIKDAGPHLNSLTESQFKHGVQAILGEPGQFKDWGGEKSDLYSTRCRLNAKRRAVAFAFKGPGLRGKLVPGRMGKNGDQMPRLFQEEADIYFVQHWREIDSSVVDLMHSLAVAKSVMTGKQIWYGVIDGKDSERLRVAYASKFNLASRKRK